MAPSVRRRTRDGVKDTHPTDPAIAPRRNGQNRSPRPGSDVSARAVGRGSTPEERPEPIRRRSPGGPPSPCHRTVPIRRRAPAAADVVPPSVSGELLAPAPRRAAGPPLGRRRDDRRRRGRARQVDGPGPVDPPPPRPPPRRRRLGVVRAGRRGRRPPRRRHRAGPRRAVRRRRRRRRRRSTPCARRHRSPSASSSTTSTSCPSAARPSTCWPTWSARCPAHAHLVLAGRSMPALPLARLRAAERVLDVTQECLGVHRRRGRPSLAAGGRRRRRRPGRARRVAGARPPGHRVARPSHAEHVRCGQFVWEEVVSRLDPGRPAGAPGAGHDGHGRRRHPGRRCAAPRSTSTTWSAPCRWSPTPATAGSGPTTCGTTRWRRSCRRPTSGRWAALDGRAPPRRRLLRPGRIAGRPPRRHRRRVHGRAGPRPQHALGAPRGHRRRPGCGRCRRTTADRPELLLLDAVTRHAQGDHDPEVDELVVARRSTSSGPAATTSASRPRSGSGSCWPTPAATPRPRSSWSTRPPTCPDSTRTARCACSARWSRRSAPTSSATSSGAPRSSTTSASRGSRR